MKALKETADDIHTRFKNGKLTKAEAKAELLVARVAADHKTEASEEPPAAAEAKAVSVNSGEGQRFLANILNRNNQQSDQKELVKETKASKELFAQAVVHLDNIERKTEPIATAEFGAAG